MALRFLAACIVLSLPLIACERSTSDKDLTLVRADEVLALGTRDKGLLGKSKRVVIIDPRPMALYEAGHIKGARSMPMPTMNDVAVPELGDFKSVAILVYGTNANDVLGPAASKRLIELGYDSVYTLRGGLEGWTKASMPVVTGKDPG